MFLKFKVVLVEITTKKPKNKFKKFVNETGETLKDDLWYELNNFYQNLCKPSMILLTNFIDLNSRSNVNIFT